MFVPKDMFTCTEGLKCRIIYNNNKECILVYGKKNQNTTANFSIYSDVMVSCQVWTPYGIHKELYSRYFQWYNVKKMKQSFGLTVKPPKYTQNLLHGLLCGFTL